MEDGGTAQRSVWRKVMKNVEAHDLIPACFSFVFPELLSPVY